MLDALAIVKKFKNLHRLLRNMVRLGSVVEVVGDRAVIQYQSGTRSPLIRWVSLAGAFSAWRAPSVGEQVVTLNYSGGDDETACVALVGLYSNAHPSKSQDPHQAHFRWDDFFDATVSDDGSLLVDLKTNIVLNAGQKIVIKAGQQIVMNAGNSINVSTSDYTRKASTATTEGVHTQKGKVDIKGALDVSTSVKTPAILSYAAGAFSMDSSGASISHAIITSCTVNGKSVDGHDHDGNVTPF
ncbi:phage baseplate assembly protein V [Vibrio aquimaris]|uniref:Phage-related baseplate assembly protein n=1 Tax=Vibrio aquimaris TaxID=2587862 RepID=A0A5P9CRL3_9VIBR|nr:phage baseplate assembly protein V [Vibrio aquimaris]QFT28846.1 Phage-related baseplate assembly protein [Vibrio aquimaris]